MDLDKIFIKCLKWDKEQSVKNTISMLMVGFQSTGIILWSRHSIGGLSCLGGGLRPLSALVYDGLVSVEDDSLKLRMCQVAVNRSYFACQLNVLTENEYNFVKLFVALTKGFTLQQKITKPYKISKRNGCHNNTFHWILSHPYTI